MSYVKLFNSLTASTIWNEDNETRLLWITMLVLANRDGIVEGSIPGLAVIARVSMEGATKAIDSFLSPDPWSRTKENEGRRIEVVDGGWRLLNYEFYRQKSSAAEAKENANQRAARYRARVKDRESRENVTPRDIVINDHEKYRKSPSPPPSPSPSPVPENQSRAAAAASVSAARSGTAAALTVTEWAEPDRTEIADKLARELCPLHWVPSGIPMAKAALERVLAKAVDPVNVAAAIRQAHEETRSAPLSKSISNQQLCYWISDEMYLNLKLPTFRAAYEKPSALADTVEWIMNRGAK